MVATPTNTLTLEKVQQAVALILDELGDPQTEAQQQALQAYNSDDHAKVKRIALMNPTDYFCKSLGYLGGALKLTPNTDTILAESLRAAVDYSREVKLHRLGWQIGKILE